MNILVPDSWLREFLQTKATPKQIKEYLSLCGPSVERIHQDKGETVYDIEVTTNRPDSMSVLGIAREAAAILPRFGIVAKLVNDPYTEKTDIFVKNHTREGPKKLSVITDPELNPRWTSIILTNVKVGPSPAWLAKKLELTGIRPLNNIVDITNYLMRAYGQPAHAFDYDSIKPKKGIPTMRLRASKKGEKLITLDGKAHTLPGGDIVIEDGSGTLIDLCGIMGAENSSIKETTVNVVLFLQTYDPVRIRRTSMALSHRTEAASLFEKGVDTELVLPAIIRGVELSEELAGAVPTGKLYDIYPAPFKPYRVSVTRKKLDAYLGISLDSEEISKILTALGFKAVITSGSVTVSVPSYRRDVTIDVDVIEEVARVYGYHAIANRLPDTEPPVVVSDKTLAWEEEIKIRMRDWGFTETYSYSMISGELMRIFSLDTTKTYKIANPLSAEWVYMRPDILPGMLKIVEENLHTRDVFKLFELSMEYHYRENNLPHERPTLIAVWVGDHFLRAKGLAEVLLHLFGIQFPSPVSQSDSPYLSKEKSAIIGEYGLIGVVDQRLLSAMKIHSPVTIMKLQFDSLVNHAQPQKQYTPIPKYPPVIEDFSFVVPNEFLIGNLLQSLQSADPLIKDVTLIDAYKSTRTIRVAYLHPDRTLTDTEVQPVRKKIIATADKLGARLKTQT